MDDAVPRLQLKRVDPFLGLLIDAETWRDSHDYHRQAEYAHALAMHGWGIVSGLDVDAADPPDRSVWIRPGVALDSEGRLIIVAQPFRYQINTQEAGTVYLVLMFREILTQPALSLEDGQERPSRILEAYEISERVRLPDQPHVELARMQLSAGRKPVRDAADSTAPKTDEIDTRYRELAAIRPGVRTTVGVWKSAEAPESLTNHLAGPTRLLADLSGSLDRRLRRRDPSGGDEPLDCDFLYLPIYARLGLSEAERRHLISFLDSGGVILAEHCVVDGDDGAKRLTDLGKELDRKPKPVTRNHPLLVAQHVFSAPPPGGANGAVAEDGGLVLSNADYACAWNGGAPDKELGRAAIRTAVEFAENLLAYTLARRGEARRIRRSEQRR